MDRAARRPRRGRERGRRRRGRRRRRGGRAARAVVARAVGAVGGGARAPRRPRPTRRPAATATLVGRVATHVFDKAGRGYAVTLREWRRGANASSAAAADDDDDDDAWTLARPAAYALVACKYVRRELRTLTAADRETFLYALEVVHRTETAEGRALYGDGFVGVDVLLKQHLANYTAAGPSETLVSRAKFFQNLRESPPGTARRCTRGSRSSRATPRSRSSSEQSLRAVAADAPALPYWDYVADYERLVRPRANDTARRANGTSAACRECMFDSEVFNASWFGGFDTAAPLHAVRDGRPRTCPCPPTPRSPRATASAG